LSLHQTVDSSKMGFQSHLTEMRLLIDSRLDTFLEGISGFTIHPLIKYAVLSGGKRLRPVMSILSCESVCGSRESVVPLALAFELIHSASLVHDDIIDGDRVRRGVPALHEKWSMEDAIIAGDALIALAIELSAGYGSDVIRLVSKCSIELCEGERLELEHSLGDATEERYFEKVRKKSASLFRAAAEAGAKVGGGTRREVRSLAHFGESFGVAYQIRDDIVDLLEAEGRGSNDLELGRVTLPIIHFYERSDEDRRAFLEKFFGKPRLGEEVLGELVRAIKEARSIEYCEDKIRENLKSASDCLRDLEETSARTHLSNMLSLIAGDYPVATLDRSQR